MQTQKKAIIISPEYPGDFSGYQLAIKSSYEIYKKYYSNVDLVVIGDSFSDHKNIHFIKARKLNKYFRLILSIFNGNPSITVKYNSFRIRRKLKKIIKNIIKFDSEKYDLIFEDLPVSIHLKYILNNFNSSSFNPIIRSHNVFFDLFTDLSTSYLFSKVWSFEQKKIYAFESSFFKYIFIPISYSDSLRYNEVYKVFRPHMDVVVKIHQRINKKPKNRNIQIIGGFDLRKKKGITDVITTLSLNEFKSIKLFLIGKGSLELKGESTNIKKLGFVQDLTVFHNKRDIFLNIQKVGSGINLKSLTAISRGYLLISTNFGIKGISLVHNESFISIDEFNNLEEAIEYTISLNEIEYLSIIKNAQNIIDSFFNENHVNNQYNKIINR
jgi:hypothetical protein